MNRQHHEEQTMHLENENSEKMIKREQYENDNMTMMRDRTERKEDENIYRPLTPELLIDPGDRPKSNLHHNINIRYTSIHGEHLDTSRETLKPVALDTYGFRVDIYLVTPNQLSF